MRRFTLTFFFVLISSMQAFAQVGTITTIAGGGPNNIPAISADLLIPGGVAVDRAGNYFIVAQGQDRIFKVDTSGQLTVVAGNGIQGFSGDGGPATNASLSDPIGVAIDASGNLFIADGSNHRIRRVDAATQIITTVAGNGTFIFSGNGGPATNAGIRRPSGLAVDTAGNLFIVNQSYRILRVDSVTQIITTVVGNGTRGFSGDGGPATSANMSEPVGVAIDAAGNLFIADTVNRRIRRVDAATQIITTVAGNGTSGFSGDGGPATSASISPLGIAVDSTGNLFIADAGNNRIRRVDAASQIITTVAGNGTSGFSGDGGPATNASLDFLFPTGVAIDATGNLFIADTVNRRIRRVDAATQIITTVAGSSAFNFSGDGGSATSASLSRIFGVAIDVAGNLFIADTINHRIRRVDAATQIITTVAGNGTSGFSGDGGPATRTRLWSPTGVAVDSGGNLFIADTVNRRVRRVDAATQIITTVAGNGTSGFGGDGGPATSAPLNRPLGVAVDSGGNLFIADKINHRIRRVDAATQIITTVAGNGTSGFSGDSGPATNASLKFPFGVAVDSEGNLFIADTINHRIRRVDAATQIITTVAGNGTSGFSGDGGPATSASFTADGVAVDSTGNLFISDQNNHRIRRVDAATQIITTVAGNGTRGFSGDGGPASNASLKFPFGVAVDSAGSLFIADQGNHRIRKVKLPIASDGDGIPHAQDTCSPEDPRSLVADGNGCKTAQPQ